MEGHARTTTDIATTVNAQRMTSNAKICGAMRQNLVQMCAMGRTSKVQCEEIAINLETMFISSALGSKCYSSKPPLRSQ